ncbi:MAG: hypothetical protein IJY89_02525, partial [Clostridia bacterium]|nr:hypothetical protein [Clostridia bacterium]
MKKQNIISIAICTLLLLMSVTFFGAAAETLTEAGEQLRKYDLNGDGSVTIADVALLLDYIGGNCGHREVALPDKE